MTVPERDERVRHAEEAFTAAAELLATEPEAIQRALAAHRRAPDGRCAACGTISRWPCAIATIAHRAADLAQPRRSGPPAGRPQARPHSNVPAGRRP